MSDSSDCAGREPSRTHRWRSFAQVLTTVVTGCDHAGVLDSCGTSVRCLGGTSAALRADGLQRELSQGPAIEALGSGEPVVAQHLARDDRWPRWSAALTDTLGLVGALAVPGEGPTGRIVVSLYATRPDAWCSSSLTTAGALVQVAAMLAHDVAELSHLRRGLATRGMIGQALGIVRERYGLDAEEAFGYLRRLSQDGNRKLSVLAADIVDTGPDRDAGRCDPGRCRPGRHLCT